MTGGPDRLHWVPEATALAICGLKRATWSTWAQQGYVDRPEDGAYGLEEVLRVALTAELRKVLPTDELTAALRDLDRENVVERIARQARTLRDDDALDLIVEPESGQVTLATDDAEIVAAVRHPTAPRRVIVISPAAELCRVVRAFDNRAHRGARPAKRARGRPRAVVKAIGDEAG